MSIILAVRPDAGQPEIPTSTAARRLDIEPNPDGNRIVGNLVLGNGGTPAGIPALDALRADLGWDGTGTGNCWLRNTFATSAPVELPGCGR